MVIAFAGFLMFGWPCTRAAAQLETNVSVQDRVMQDQHGNTADPLPDAPSSQEAAAATSTSQDSADSLRLSQTPSRLLRDEWHILTAPVHIQRRDLRWLLPLAGASAAALATDTYTMRHVVSTSPSFNSSNDTTSTVLRDMFIGAPIALFGSGELGHNQHQRDAGLLAGQAMINAYATDVAIKFIFLRERPQLTNARGHFFTGDAASDPSFVSGHAIVAWSSAAALAGEYSKPWQQVGLYTMATGVSLTRVLAQQHFPTDVLLGSVAGWLIGHYVVRAHRPPHGSSQFKPLH